jgi:hypothetical protein
MKKSKDKPKIPCPYCGKLWYHIADAFNCADLNVKEQESKDKVLTLIKSTK